MVKRFKKLKSLLAVTLSAAMILTAVPQSALGTKAAEASDEITAEALEIAEEVSAEEAQEPAVEEAQVSETEETQTEEAVEEETAEQEAPLEAEAAVTEESAVSPESEPAVTEESAVSPEAEASVEESDLGDKAVDLDEYQTTKLKVTKKTTTLYTGQEKALVALVGYDKDTKDTGRGEKNFETLIYYIDSWGEEQEAGDSFTIIKDDAHEQLFLSVDDWANPGKYMMYLYPVVPSTGNEDFYVRQGEVSIPLTVKTGINGIDVEMPCKYLYKAEGKPAAMQATYTVRAAFSSDTPASKAVTWDAAWDSSFAKEKMCDASEVTVKNGKVTVNKNFKPSDEKKTLWVRAKANDYAGNTAYGLAYVILKTTAADPKSLDLYQGSKKLADDKTEFTFAEAFNLQVKVAEEGGAADSGNYTFKSSNAKVVAVDQDGDIIPLQATGKAVTITATAKDGSMKKVTRQIKIVKKKVTLDSLSLSVNYEIALNAKNKEASYNGEYNGAPLMVYMTSDSGIDLLDATLKVKGGKDVSAKFAKMQDLGSYGPLIGKSMFVIVPTAKTVEFTLKVGKESATYKLTDNNFATDKLKAAKGEKITTSVTFKKDWDTQTQKICVGKANAGKRVVFAADANFVLGGAANMKLYDAMYSYNFYKSLTVDSEGYVEMSVKNIASMYSDLQWDFMEEGIKGKPGNSAKMMMLITDGSKALYAPVTLTVKFTDVKSSSSSSYKREKNDFKLKKDYKLEEMTVGGETFIGAKITYTGKEPKAKLDEILYFEGGLSVDKMDADVWLKALEFKYINGEYYLALKSYGKELLKEAKKGTGAYTGSLDCLYWVETPKSSWYLLKDTIKVTYVIPEN